MKISAYIWCALIGLSPLYPWTSATTSITTQETEYPQSSTPGTTSHGYSSSVKANNGTTTLSYGTSTSSTPSAATTGGALEEENSTVATEFGTSYTASTSVPSSTTDFSDITLGSGISHNTSESATVIIEIIETSTYVDSTLGLLDNETTDVPQNLSTTADSVGSEISVEFTATPTVTSTELPETCNSIEDLQTENTTSNSTVVVWSIAISRENVEFCLCYGMAANADAINESMTDCTTTSSNASCQIVLSPSVSIFNLKAFMNYTACVYARCENASSDVLCAAFKTAESVPGPPLDVCATNITTESVQLNWMEPGHPNGVIRTYTVCTYVKGSLPPVDCTEDTCGTISVCKTVGGDVTMTEIDGLEFCTEYVSTVQAETSAGCGNVSEPTSFVTDSIAPTIQDFIAMTVNSTAIQLTWNVTQDASHVPLWFLISMDAANSSESVRHFNISGNELLVDDLKPWTEYRFCILGELLCKTAVHRGSWVCIPSGTDEGVPGPPLNVVIASTTSTELHVRWTEPSEPNGRIQKYTVCATVPGFSFSSECQELIGGNIVCKKVSAADTATEITELESCTDYNVSIRAETSSGCGDASEPVTAKTEGTAPIVHGVNATALNSTAVKLGWSVIQRPADRPGIFNIFVRPKLLSDKFQNFTTEDKEYITGNLRPWSGYSFCVSGELTCKNVAYVGQENCTVEWTLEDAPGPPKNVHFTNVSSDAVHLAWNPPADPNGLIKRYIACVYTQTVFSAEFPRLPGCTSRISSSDAACEFTAGNETTTEISGLYSCTKYVAMVWAETSAGCGNASELVWEMTNGSAIAAPNATVCGVTSTTATLKWTFLQPRSGTVSFNITVDGSTANVQTLISNVPECIVTNLTPWSNYTICVRGLVTCKAEVHVGQPNCRRAQTSEGIPPIPLRHLHPIPHAHDIDDEHQVAFSFPKGIFSTRMGDISRYSLLVGLDAATIAPRNGTTDESYTFPTWYHVIRQNKLGPYQATPDNWNPFGDTGTLDANGICRSINATWPNGVMQIVCILGLEVDCEVRKMEFCNGPLESGVTYWIKLRGFTKAGFSDTEAMQVTTAKQPPKSVHPGVVAAVVVFTFIGGILAIMFVYYRKKGWPFKKPRKREEARPVTQNGIELPVVRKSRPIKLVAFADHFEDMNTDSALLFSKEYDELKALSPRHPCTVAEMQENRPKNRWVNILPYDHSRVKLLPVDDDPGSDYINASYIPGFHSPREYIATQGPLPGTKDDFWRMVWEQNVSTVVMVTQCSERGKVKCEQYWPDDRDSHYFGDLKLQLVSESILSGYIIRVINLQLGARGRSVKQMHFTVCPDFGCPENTELFVNFVRAVRDHLPHGDVGPLVVHCSAGVGRTGTFIALDRVMQQLQRMGSSLQETVDVFGTVLDMRQHRTNMVQTEDQYIYIHECIKDIIVGKLAAKDEESASAEAIYSNVKTLETEHV